MGVFLKITLHGSCQTPFPFLFVVIMHLLWYQPSVCAPTPLNGSSMENLLLGREVRPGWTVKISGRRTKKWMWLWRYRDVTAFPLPYNLWALKLAAWELVNHISLPWNQWQPLTAAFQGDQDYPPAPNGWDEGGGGESMCWGCSAPADQAFLWMSCAPQDCSVLLQRVSKRCQTKPTKGWWKGEMPKSLDLFQMYQSGQEILLLI